MARGIAGAALILGVAAMVGSTDAAYIPKTIQIVNNLDVALIFKEIKKGSHLDVTDPPRKVDPGTVGTFDVSPRRTASYPLRLHVTYYVDDGSDDVVGIRYKKVNPDEKERCIHEKPKRIAQDVKHCNLFSIEEKEWQYIFTLK